MLRTTALASLFLIALSLTACDRSEPTSEPPDTTGAASKSTSKSPTADQSLALDHTRDWKPCAAMPAKLVGQALGAPAPKFETVESGKICIQTLAGDNETTETYAQLGALNVFESAKKAQSRFQSSTRDTSAAEMKELNKEIREKAKKELEKEANAEAKKDAAGQIMDALEGSATYEAVDGVGDAAAMNKEDGQLHVLSGNAYFYVLAWSGPTIGDRSAPTPEEIKAKRKAHLAKNWDKQKKMQVELASKIVENLGSK